MITVKCTECGKEFQTFPAWVRKVKSPMCSRQCNGAARGREWATHGHKGKAAWKPGSLESVRAKMTGEHNPAWKGGATYFRKHGNYAPIKYVRCPPEFVQMARKDGYVMEHRLIVARLIGRPLARVEVVHHVDHNPQNNDPLNLELWPDNRSHKLAEHGRFALGAANRLSLAA